MNTNAYADNFAAYTADLLADVVSDSATTELDAQEEMMLEDIEAVITAKANKIFAYEYGAEQTTLELVRSALDLYFSTGEDKVLDTYAKTVRKLASSAKSAEHRTRVSADFNTGLWNGLGRLVKTDRIDKQGNTLYEHDANMVCVRVERGKFQTISNSKRKAVRDRYVNELRKLNLVRPRMYRDFAKRNELRNKLQFIEDLETMKKRYDTETGELIDRIITAEKVKMLERARRAQDKAAA